MSRLPAEFADLEPLASEWSLTTETERNRKRLRSSMEEIRSFADAVLSRLDAIFVYVERYPLDALPPDAERLFHLTLSLAEVAPALECYGRPDVTDGLPSERMPATEGFPLRPVP